MFGPDVEELGEVELAAFRAGLSVEELLEMMAIDAYYEAVAAEIEEE
jgi:hypothetical protein